MANKSIRIEAWVTFREKWREGDSPIDKVYFNFGEGYMNHKDKLIPAMLICKKKYQK